MRTLNKKVTAERVMEKAVSHVERKEDVILPRRTIYRVKKCKISPDILVKDGWMVKGKKELSASFDNIGQEEFEFTVVLDMKGTVLKSEINDL